MAIPINYMYTLSDYVQNKGHLFLNEVKLTVLFTSEAWTSYYCILKHVVLFLKYWQLKNPFNLHRYRKFISKISNTTTVALYIHLHTFIHDILCLHTVFTFMFLWIMLGEASLKQTCSPFPMKSSLYIRFLWSSLSLPNILYAIHNWHSFCKCIWEVNKASQVHTFKDTMFAIKP